MKDVSALFENSIIKAPDQLRERVFIRIGEAQVHSVRQARIVWGTVSVLSVATLIASSTYAVHAYSISSFGNYFSLIFSDIGSAATWWRELGLSLLESLPLAGTGLLLGSVIFMLWSFRKFAKGTDIFITQRGLIPAQI